MSIKGIKSKYVLIIGICIISIPLVVIMIYLFGYFYYLYREEEYPNPPVEALLSADEDTTNVLWCREMSLTDDKQICVFRISNDLQEKELRAFIVKENNEKEYIGELEKRSKDIPMQYLEFSMYGEKQVVGWIDNSVIGDPISLEFIIRNLEGPSIYKIHLNKKRFFVSEFTFKGDGFSDLDYLNILSCEKYNKSSDECMIPNEYEFGDKGNITTEYN